MSNNVNSLFQNAKAEGNLTVAGAQVLAIPDLGAQIQEGLGICVDDVDASETTLVTMLIDDSGSIRFGSNSQLMRDGHNLVIDSLVGSKQSDGVLAHCRYLNGTVLYPYCALDQAIRLNERNYNPCGGTPLYDQTAIILGTVLAKYQEFSDAGTTCRTVTAIITDGADEHSVTHRTAAALKPLVMDMLKTEMHIIAAMGIDDGRTDFRRIFGEMGIPDEWILTPKNTQSEIRRAFGRMSKSAVRVSQASGGNFSTVAAGGFGG